MDAGLGEGVVGGFDRPGEIDGAGEVFEDDGFESELGGGEGGEADAEVVGDAGEEQAVQFAFAKVAGEPGGGGAVVFEEGGVAVDLFAEALAEDEFDVGKVEVGVEFSSVGSLDTVIGPEVLGAVGGLDGVCEGLLVMGAGERDVMGGVPVLGDDDVFEAIGEGVEVGDDLVGVGDGEGAAGEEVVLHVDDEEGVGGQEMHVVSMVAQARRLGTL